MNISFHETSDAALKGLRVLALPSPLPAASGNETDLPLNFQVAAWFDQRNTIRLLASVLPNGYKLLVWEHRHNFGLRPASYYRGLLRLGAEA